MIPVQKKLIGFLCAISWVMVTGMVMPWLFPHYFIASCMMLLVLTQAIVSTGVIFKHYFTRRLQ